MNVNQRFRSYRSILLLAAVTILCIGIVAARFMLRAHDLAEVALTRLRELPLPPDTVLLAQDSSSGGGSDERCDAGTASALYGSSRSPLEILDFYGEYAREAQFTEVETLDATRGPSLSLRQNENGHTRIDVFLQPSDPSPYKKYSIAIPDLIIDEALATYPVTYWIEVGYIPAAVLSQCGR